jgi:hypothetical protein
MTDHRDGNGLNNQRHNLRICTAKENGRNQRINSVNTSGYKGVSWKKDQHKWLSQIIVDNRAYNLGTFVCPLRAAKAYNDAAEKYFGEFARPNELPKMNCFAIAVRAKESE